MLVLDAPAVLVLVADSDVAELDSSVSELDRRLAREVDVRSLLAGLVVDVTTDEATLDVRWLGVGEGDSTADDEAAEVSKAADRLALAAAANDEAAATADEALAATAADDEASMHGRSGLLEKEKLHGGPWQLHDCQSGPGRGETGETNNLTLSRHTGEQSMSPARLLQPWQLVWAATAAARLRTTTTAAVFIWVSAWRSRWECLGRWYV